MNAHSLLPLELLRPGESAEVADVRRAVLGVPPRRSSASASAVGFAVLRDGSPCLIQVDGCCLSLRGDPAMQISSARWLESAVTQTWTGSLAVLDEAGAGKAACPTGTAMTSLDQLRPDSAGPASRPFRAGAASIHRLMEMGLLEGDEVEVIALAPLGGPIEVRLGDYRLSLRRTEAARVEVSPLP